jgi:hypothetical protein
LFEELRKTTEGVQTHTWWERCGREGIQGASLVAARMLLKQIAGADSLPQDDVDAAA